MTASDPTTRHYTVRQAAVRDFRALLAFYREHASDALSPPSAKTVGDTIGQGRILLVEEQASAAIVASGALFELSPTVALTYVGELAGMRATRAVGGLKPMTIQAVLLGLRLLGHVANEAQALRKGATRSIVTIVKEDNAASIRNIESIGMKPLLRRPDWFQYDEFMWYGAAGGPEWKYYYADPGTVVEALRQLAAVGLFENQIRLNRIDRASGQAEEFAFHLQLKDIARAAPDLKGILESGAGVDLVSPPDDIQFAV
jgi:hypothetical protein